MATYLPGITDYIPQIQPFKPNLGLYATVLQTKQNRYDSALSKLSNIYGTLLYSKLSAPENIKRRDDYFKMIEQDIKKITSMDLSLPQNQAIAQDIFKPLIDDKHLQADWVFTKQVDSQVEYGESFKRCKKPEDCGGEWWQGGITYLYEKLNEFVQASPEDRLKMKAPSYVPYQNVQRKLWDWANSQNNNKGITVEAAYNNGGYIIKKQNGAELLPTLEHVFTSLLANDPSVIEMYKVKAYLSNKESIQKELAFNNNDPEKAENAWYSKILNQTGQRLLELDDDAKTLKDKVGLKKAVIEEKIKEEGVPVNNLEDDPLMQHYLTTQEEEEIADTNYKFFSNIKDLMKTTDDSLDNKELLKSKIQDITAYALLYEDVKNVSTSYAAAHNAVTSIVADPLYLQFKGHQYSMERMKTQYDLDLRNRLVTESFKASSSAMSKLMMIGDGGTPTYTDGVNGNNAGQSTPAFGKEGAYNLVEEAFRERETGLKERQYTQNKYMKTYVDYLDNIIESPTASSDTRRFAKLMKLEVFGKSNYDPDTNEYINGNVRSSNFYDMNFDNQKILDFYKNAVPNVLKYRDIGIFTPQVKLNFQALQDDESAEFARFTAANEVIKYNTNAVFNFAGALPEGTLGLGGRNKIKFDRLFKDEGGVKTLKDINTYVKEAVASMPGPPPGENRQDWLRKAALQARNDYTDAFGLFTKLYHEMPGKKTLPGITLINSSADGGRTASSKTAVFDFDQAIPAYPGTEGIVSVLKNFPTLTNDQYKVLGPTVIVDDVNISATSLTADEFKQVDSSPNAKLLLQTLEADFKNVYDSGNMQKRPAGKIYRNDIAANNGNMISYTIIPSLDWLSKFQRSAGPGKGNVAFGYNVEDLAKNGITIYQTRKSDNTVLGREFSMKPYDALVMQGVPLKISRENTGNIVIKKTGDRIYVSGELFMRDGNNAVVNSVKFNPNEYNYYVGDNSFSPGQLYAGLKELVDQLYINNSNAKLGLPTIDKLYSPEQIPQILNQMRESALRRQGLTQPSVAEKTIADMQERIRFSTQMANQLMR